MIVEARIVDALSDGILVGCAGSVVLTNCELTSNDGHGVVVFAPGTPPANPTSVAVNGCNLTANTGDGVSSPTATISIAATGNWWGDATGPFGPAADGVSGVVSAGGWLTAPVALGY